MLGSATLTIVVSKTAMKEPVSTTARICQLRFPCQRVWTGLCAEVAE
jgi:hypothetical protein